MKKGDLVRYHGRDNRIWYGKLLSVKDAKEDTLIVYHERKDNSKWSMITIPKADVEEVA